MADVSQHLANTTARPLALPSRPGTHPSSLPEKLPASPAAGFQIILVLHSGSPLGGLPGRWKESSFQVEFNNNKKDPKADRKAFLRLRGTNCFIWLRGSPAFDWVAWARSQKCHGSAPIPWPYQIEFCSSWSVARAGSFVQPLIPEPHA